METIEKILEAKSYDAKNILNRASNTSLSQTVLDDIENDGVTSEYLETLDVPVFKYQTQITIHGMFPELQGNGRINGYKHIFQNKNMSLGVKYDAIDAKKKHKIYETISELTDFNVHHSCSEYYLFKYYAVKTMEDAKQKSTELCAEYAHIDSKLYFGSFGVNLLRDAYGRLFVEKYLIVTAIYEKNVYEFIENVLKMSIAETKFKLQEKKAATKKYWDDYAIESERKKVEYAELQRPLHEQAIAYLTGLGYSEKKVEISEGLVVVKYEIDQYDGMKIKYRGIAFSKQKRERMFRKNVVYYGAELPETMEFKPIYFNDKYDNSVITAWVKEVEKVPEIKAEVVKLNVITEPNLVTIQIVDYSEKAIAIIGDTKPIKDLLKELGGSFNMRLSCGAGWIFSKKSEQRVRVALSL